MGLPPVYFKDQKVILVLCECGSFQHSLVISKDIYNEIEYSIDIHHSNDFSFWGRIKQAIRFIFKGPWNDGIILSSEQIEELYKKLGELKK